MSRLNLEDYPATYKNNEWIIIILTPFSNSCMRYVPVAAYTGMWCVACLDLLSSLILVKRVYHINAHCVPVMPFSPIADMWHFDVNLSKAYEVKIIFTCLVGLKYMSSSIHKLCSSECSTWSAFALAFTMSATKMRTYTYLVVAIVHCVSTCKSLREFLWCVSLLYWSLISLLCTFKSLCPGDARGG